MANTHSALTARPREGWFGVLHLWVLAAIVSVGAALRWLSPGRIGLWRDEAQFIAIAGKPSLSAITSFLYHEESHPPLYYWLGHWSKALFGSVEGPMSGFAIAVSLMAVILAYKVAASAFSRISGILAASVTALSIPLTVFSVQIRPYGLIGLLLLLSFGSLWRFWRLHSACALVMWAISIVALMYLHYMAVLVFAAQLLLVTWVWSKGDKVHGKLKARFLVAVGLSVAVMVPALFFLTHQAVTSGYPALRPVTWHGPPRLLLTIGLSFPLEIGLPIAASAFLAVSAARRRTVAHVVRREDFILLGGAPVFFLMATIASYRSQFLSAHVLLSLVPTASILLAGWIHILYRSGTKWLAALWFELTLCAAVMSGILFIGYTKTTVDVVAAGIRAAAAPTDLILVIPGAVGASFNRYFQGAQSQINFPYVQRLEVYPFGNDVEKVAAGGPFETTMDSIYGAYTGGRAVWFVSEIRWIRPEVPAPDAIPLDSLGGIGQADKARANRFYRYLRWLYGPPVIHVGANDPRASGIELIAGVRFAPQDSLKVYPE